MATPYISRAEALALIVEQRGPGIIQQATQQSVVMSTFTRRQISTKQAKVALAETFPTAQWLTAPPAVDVDIAEKPVTEMSWGQQTVDVEEIATVVVIPENVLADAEVNLWTEVRQWAETAIARLIDQTVLFGTAPSGSVPASLPVGGVVGQAIAAGNTYVWGTGNASEDMAEAWNQTMALVEEDGYDVNQAYADRGVRPYFRGLRDGNGVPMYATDLRGGAVVDAVYGVPISYTNPGTWDKTKALALMGDGQYAVLFLRSGLEAKVLTEAVVGDINLPLQDAVGLRLKMRLTYAVMAPKGPGQPANPYPFAVLAPKAVGP